jgi:putative endonuclease
MKIETWYLYILLCDQKTFYVGITNDLKNRIVQHKTKQSFFTKKFSDVRLVYCEKYLTDHEAALREKQIKGWSRTKKQMLIDGKLGINTCTEVVEFFSK